MIDAPPRAYAATYDASDPARLEFGAVVTQNFVEGFGAEAVIESYRALAAEDVDRSFGHVACATASQMFGAQAQTKVGLAPYARFGVLDTLGINALDPTARGVLLVGLLPAVRSVDASAAQTWTQVAAHVAAARRLREVLGGPLGSDPARSPAVEAILGPTGKLEHAADDEARAARGALVAAVAAVERARTKAGRKRPLAVLAGWKAMVEARWSLVEHFERDGKRYVVAVRNDAVPPPAAAQALATLTLRERQVVAYTLLGHTNKVAAYELGIAASTLRVLLARALKKLGLPSTAALLQLARRPPNPAQQRSSTEQRQRGEGIRS